jgi:phage shock protein PspC (stress-responsive transcriptional regulator)
MPAEPSGAEQPTPPPDPAAPAGGPPPAGAAPPPTGAGWPPPAAPPVRRLVRRADHRVLAGVASGIADYFHVDPVLIRIGFIVLTFAAGVGPLLYVLAWLFVPAQGSAESIAQSALGRPPTLRSAVGVALVLVAVAVLASSISRPSVIWAAVLIAFGIYLFRQEPHAAAAGPHAAAAGPPPPGGAAAATATAPLPPPPAAWGAGAATAPAAGWSAGSVTEPLVEPPSPGAPAPRWEPPPGWTPPGQAGPPAWGAPPPPRPPRPRSLLFPLTLGLAFLATGVAALLHNLGAFDLTLGQGLAIFLTVLGLGLLVGAWWGRAWGLIPFGLVLAPVVAAAALFGSAPLGPGTGQRLWQPGTLAEIQPSYRLGAGDTTLDLSRVRLGPGPVHVEVGVGAGRIVAIVPDDAPVDLHARAGVGTIDLLGHRSEGSSLDATHAEGAAVARRGETVGPLGLDLHVGFGEVQVVRARDAAGQGLQVPAAPTPAPVPPTTVAKGVR